MIVEEQGERCFLRWNIHQRIQHIMLLTAFTVLVVTGFPIRYATKHTAYVVTELVGGAYAASIIHRFAAGLLILTAIYHLLYLGYQAAKGERATAMWPSWKDVTDFYRMIGYNLGLLREKPKLGKYTFAEKFEYWAVIWGGIVMIGTGALLWTPVLTATYFPAMILGLARVIHSYEALLAFVAILIWHFYHAHLRPDVFPMSSVWLTGLMPEKEMKERHQLEYERIIGEDEDTETSG